jgi:hypothetical protein
VKIKLVVVDQMKDSSIQQEIRKLISPIISDLNVTSVGLFHTALLIGPWFIEWNDSALCIPRKCSSKSAFLTIDIGEIKSLESLEVVRDKLSDVIVYWNSNIEYATFGKKSSKSGNCQEFIESILSALNLNLNYEGAVGDFLQNIKKFGSSKLIFTMNDEFRKNFNIKEKSIEFKTHTQLDQFVKNLDHKDEYLESSYPDEYALLKSFDRAFWLKHHKITQDSLQLRKALDKPELLKVSPEELEDLKKKKSAQLEKLKEDGKFTRPYSESSGELSKHSCPFKDPIETKSFWLEK